MMMKKTMEDSNINNINRLMRIRQPSKRIVINAQDILQEFSIPSLSYSFLKTNVLISRQISFIESRDSRAQFSNDTKVDRVSSRRNYEKSRAPATRNSWFFFFGTIGLHATNWIGPKRL